MVRFEARSALTSTRRITIRRSWSYGPSNKEGGRLSTLPVVA